MNFFGKKPDSNPQIIFGAIAATYSNKEELWTFEYEGVEHISYGNILRLLNNSALELMRGDVVKLMPEMKYRLELGWKEWGNVRIGDGESYFINATDFQEKQEYEICWTDGASWGDMSIDFTIKDHQIINEDWND